MVHLISYKKHIEWLRSTFKEVALLGQVHGHGLPISSFDRSFYLHLPYYLREECKLFWI